MNSRGLHRVQPTVWSPVRYDPEGVALRALINEFGPFRAGAIRGLLPVGCTLVITHKFSVLE
jgi:hypothetical protein